MPTPRLRLVTPHSAVSLEEETLSAVFAALADPVRRAILLRLGEGELLVSQLAEPFDISLQAVSKHIRVLVLAGLVRQERTGRISLCRLDAGPILAAAVWLNRYSKHWQSQFETLAYWLDRLERLRGAPSSEADSARNRSGTSAKRGPRKSRRGK